MQQQHPLALRALAALRRQSGRFVDNLGRFEVIAAQGARKTRAAKTDGWGESWDVLREQVEPCFTLSAGRSGTMTLALLGGLSSELESVHEPLPHLLTESFLEHSDEDADPDFWRAVIGEARDWPIRAAHHRGKIWFETNNRLTFLSRHLADHFPRSKFIILTRHPEKYAASAIARDYYTNHPWDFARVVPRPKDDAFERWDTMSQLERVGWLWNRTYEAAVETADVIDSDRVMIVKSEDLFQQKQDLVGDIFAFAGASRPPSARSIAQVLGRQANAQEPRPGSQRSEWDPEETELFLDQVAPQMRRFGYAPT